MIAALYVLFVLNCLFLIMVVLLQAGKGDGLAGVFGGGGASGTILGNRGAATFLSKLTVASAVLFMLLSIILAFDASRSESRVGRGSVDPQDAPGMGFIEDGDDSDEDDDEAVDEEPQDELDDEERGGVELESGAGLDEEEGAADDVVGEDPEVTETPEENPVIEIPDPAGADEPEVDTPEPADDETTPADDEATPADDEDTTSPTDEPEESP